MSKAHSRCKRNSKGTHMNQAVSASRSYGITARLDRFDWRVGELLDNDFQFAAVGPDTSTYAGFSKPGARLALMIETVIERCTDRATVGERPVKVVTDPEGDTRSEGVANVVDRISRLQRHRGEDVSDNTNQPRRIRAARGVRFPNADVLDLQVQFVNRILTVPNQRKRF